MPAFDVPLSTLTQLSRLVRRTDVQERLKQAQTRRIGDSRLGVPLYRLEVTGDERDAVVYDVRTALNERGYDGGDLTACGHVYEGLERIFTAQQAETAYA